MKQANARGGNRQSASAKSGSFQDFVKNAVRIITKVWNYLYQYRSVIISIPVAIGAIWLAIRNISLLPDMVGMNLLATGDFSLMVPKLVAVLAPLVVTAFSIVLTVCSKRTLFPWLISAFTLALPLLIWITNVYPA